MPYPAELYVGHQKAITVLVFRQNNCVKIFSPCRHKLIFCKSMENVVKL